MRLYGMKEVYNMIDHANNNPPLSITSRHTTSPVRPGEDYESIWLLEKHDIHPNSTSYHVLLLYEAVVNDAY